MARQRSIIKSTLWVTMLILIGKCFGFIREALIAAYYGANAQTDAFFFAQAMPSMIFPAVGNSLALAFTSLYVSRMTTEGIEKADRYASRMLTVSLGIGVILGIVGTLISPILVPLFAPGFEGEQLTLAIHLTRLTMGAFVLIMAQYILSAILNSNKLFISSQVAGLFYNISIIAVTAILGKGQSVDVLTLTVIGGAVVQVIALIVFCRGHFHYTLCQLYPRRDTLEYFKLALPILLGNCVVQINNIVDKALGSTLDAGSLSALSYSGSLNSLVIGVFVMSLSTVLYPAITADAASGNMEHFEKTITKSLSDLSFILVPVSCITILSAQNIVSVAFGRGRFDQTAVYLTASALSFYAPYFVFSGIREVLTRGFFALQNTKTPMINGAIGVACNIVFSILFVRYLGIAGIALGTTISSFVIASLLLASTHKRIPSLTLRPFFQSFGKQLSSGGILIFVLLIFHHLVTLSHPLVCFVADMVIGFGVYLSVMFILGNENIISLFSLLKRKGKQH